MRPKGLALTEPEGCPIIGFVFFFRFFSFWFDQIIPEPIIGLYKNMVLICRTAGRPARIDRRESAAMMSEANTA